jgi:hypothetical protein
MTVTTTLNGYIRRDFEPDGPVLIRVNGAAGPDAPWEAAPAVDIRNARPLQDGAPEDAFLKNHGFALLSHHSAVQDWDSGGAMPYAQNEIARIYMPEIDTVIRQRLLPGVPVEIEQGPYLIRRGPNANGYAQGIHNDYGLTPDDYQESLEAWSTPEYAAAWRQRFDRPEVAGFMVINFWRTVYMDAALKHLPLAVCHPRTVAREDKVPAALVGFAPTGKNTNQLSLRYSAGQQWWYYPDMTTDEVLAFKIFEYMKDCPDAAPDTCFHTAFADPTAPADAPPRNSCEHRVAVFVMRD